MNGSEDGLTLESAEADCNNVHVHGSRYGVSITNATVNFRDCTFSGSPVNGAGINLDSPSTVTLTRCLVVDSKYGIMTHYRSTWHSLNITDCTFRNNTADAIHLVHWYAHSVIPATLLLHRNLFSGNSRAVHIHHRYRRINVLVEVVDNVIEAAPVNVANQASGISVSGVYVNLAAAGSHAHVKLQGNVFLNLPHSAVSISRCYRFPLQANHTTAIIANNFTGLSQTAVVIQCADTAVTLIQNNTFLQNTMDIGSSCLNISLGEVGNRESIELRIDHNEFRENSGTYIAWIIRSERSTISAGGVSSLSEFVSNTLVDNIPQDSTIYSEYSDLRMHFNTFSNQRARYELQVGFPVDQASNCTLNSWGVATEVGIAARILDHSDIPSVGSVVYVPFLNSSQFDCTKLMDCSGHGSCIYHDTCLCDTEWSGVDCSEYTCFNLYDCSNHGSCVGPSLCRCDSGWLQPDCSRTSCILQNNCSDRGVCSLPNV